MCLSFILVYFFTSIHSTFFTLYKLKEEKAKLEKLSKSLGMKATKNYAEGACDIYCIPVLIKETNISEK